MSGPYYGGSTGTNPYVGVDPSLTNNTYDQCDPNTVDYSQFTNDLDLEDYSAMLNIDTTTAVGVIPQDIQKLFPQSVQQVGIQEPQSAHSQAPTTYVQAPAVPLMPPPIPGFAGPFLTQNGSWNYIQAGTTPQFQGYPPTAQQTPVGQFYPTPMPMPPLSSAMSPAVHAQQARGKQRSQTGNSIDHESQHTRNTRKRSRAVPSPSAQTDYDELEMSDDTEEGNPVRKQRGNHKNAVKSKPKSAGKGKDRGKSTSIAERCICFTKTEKVPRPPNAFIIYRMMNSAELAKESGARSNAMTISAIAGKRWRSLSQEERARYEDLAAVAKAEHALKYPGYKYDPSKKAADRTAFGTKECKCGAYVSNVRKARAAGEELDNSVPDAERMPQGTTSGYATVQTHAQIAQIAHQAQIAPMAPQIINTSAQAMYHAQQAAVVPEAFYSQTQAPELTMPSGLHSRLALPTNGAQQPTALAANLYTQSFSAPQTVPRSDQSAVQPRRSPRINSIVPLTEQNYVPQNIVDLTIDHEADDEAIREYLLLQEDPNLAADAGPAQNTRSKSVCRSSEPMPDIEDDPYSELENNANELIDYNGGFAEADTAAAPAQKRRPSAINTNTSPAQNTRSKSVSTPDSNPVIEEDVFGQFTNDDRIDSFPSWDEENNVDGDVDMQMGEGRRSQSPDGAVRRSPRLNKSSPVS
ncbi:hypothetical protein LTR62_004920 [Meristemomyces frigidus]|uniref:HMG box domain-containing protein n=1 Tax=Meristemomyces frigidus TaxID=1508187 RepID=A0AAN7TDC3_9PEZI|nr:hypothetical protein LTR62_004920 [Meristemomyces frigidus]